MPSLGLRFRAGAVLAGGALAVHQLRYLLAYGHRAHEQLTFQGHGYLTLLGPVLASLLVLAAIEFLVRIAQATRTTSTEPALPSYSRLWMLATGWLLVIYTCQESLEGQTASGHPAGPEGVLGHGGWLAILLAAVIGGLVALVLHGAAVTIEIAARRSLARARQTEPPPRSCPPILTRDRRLDVLAVHLAGRGPPPLSV
jgi:hypothetical protein